MFRSMIATASAVLLCAVVSAAAQALLSAAEYQHRQALHDRLNEARAHQDVDTMAAIFAQDAIRVTPDGVFQGRDAIRQNLKSLSAVGPHYFISERTISRPEGDPLFDAAHGVRS